ncbi:MAG TPA: hypothetical protein VKB26_05505 [Candidatus Acidoferrales bacterium]|nr:hypothetical protein [Candidatus Acidoferrales bacterium]
MRRVFIVSVVAGLILAFGIREYRLHRKLPLEEAYIGSRGATVWNSTAQIRSPVANLAYGQSVQIYQRDVDYVLVGTKAGVRGWVASASLMDPDIWRRMALLAGTTKSMPVQAIGHTNARTNIHTRPGRQTPVILQVPGNSPVIVLTHSIVAEQPSSLAADANSTGRSEDYWLVRADVKDVGSVSGWVLGRLVSLDLPEPLPGYQSSEAMTIVAWFEINHAIDSSSGGVRPEYLVAGTRNLQSRADNDAGCDFNLARVYTWSSKHQRYETAFLDSSLCGKLPIDVTPAKVPEGEAQFRFQNLNASGLENRVYDMKLTTVRRVDIARTATAIRHKTQHRGKHVREEGQ